MEILSIGGRNENLEFSGGPLDGKMITTRGGQPAVICVRVEAIIDYYDQADSQVQRYSMPVPLGTAQYLWSDEYKRYCPRPDQETGLGPRSPGFKLPQGGEHDAPTGTHDATG